jgi:hypothetical protein
MFNGPSRSWSGGGSRRSVSLARFYRRKQKECTQKATKDAKRWGTNSEGQVKYWRCTFFGPATPDRAGARPTSNVGSRDVTWASQPTPLIPFRVFSLVSRAPFLGQSGVVTEILPDRSSCPLWPSVRLLFLHWVPVGDGFPEAKRDASPTTKNKPAVRTLTAI